MMMGNLLPLCSRRGIRLDVTEDGLDLRVSAPDGALTPQVLQSLRENKQEILAAIDLLTKNEFHELYEVEN